MAKNTHSPNLGYDNFIESEYNTEGSNRSCKEYFVAKDVAEILGYSNPKNNTRRNIKKECIKRLDIVKHMLYNKDKLRL